MTNKSSINGKAFEYACLMTLHTYVRKIRPVKIIKNSSFDVAQTCWGLISTVDQSTYIKSANAGIATISKLEPRITEQSSDIVELYLQPDHMGKSGDVRDLIIIRKPIDWEIGISIKTNHLALKHSRLSKKLDFGERWLQKPCSNAYFENIAPIFDKLTKFKAVKLKWSEVESKAATIYIPVLNAFILEIERMYGQYKSEIPKRITNYLIGSQDYYKLISLPAALSTSLMTFNIYGTLNKPAGNKNPETEVPQIKLPTRIIKIGLKPGFTNTVELIMDNGWEICFRIHSASTYVEASLKFDVQITGVPTSILILNNTW